MLFNKIKKNTKKHVERVENINIKVYTTNCVDNMQIDHLREWFFNPFFMKYMVTYGTVAYLKTSAFKVSSDIKIWRGFFSYCIGRIRRNSI